VGPLGSARDLLPRSAPDCASRQHDHPHHAPMDGRPRLSRRCMGAV